jgi:CheY-like chemotaxis protein
LARSIEEALSIAQTRRPELIVLSSKLPANLIKELAEHKIFDDVPRITIRVPLRPKLKGTVEYSVKDAWFSEPEDEKALYEYQTSMSEFLGTIIRETEKLHPPDWPLYVYAYRTMSEDVERLMRARYLKIPQEVVRLLVRLGLTTETVVVAAGDRSFIRQKISLPNKEAVATFNSLDSMEMQLTRDTDGFLYKVWLKDKHRVQESYPAVSAEFEKIATRISNVDVAAQMAKIQNGVKISSDAKKVLIIENNTLNMKLFSDLLAAFGHQPIIAQNGAEGYSLAVERRPALILMGGQLPGESGPEIVTKIKMTTVCVISQ